MPNRQNQHMSTGIQNKNYWKRTPPSGSVKHVKWTIELQNIWTSPLMITTNKNSIQSYGFQYCGVIWHIQWHCIFVTNVTLKMAELPAETCRWKYHYTNTPVELSAYCWFLIHIIQINARNMKCIKIRKIPLYIYIYIYSECNNLWISNFAAYQNNPESLNPK
jgi:hypothetical protein